MKPIQPLLGHLLVPVRIPRRLFYWATDPEHDIYVQFGSWTYLAMWKCLKNFLPMTEAFSEPRAAVTALHDSHAEWMQKHLGATEAELAGIGDTVEFVVTVPRGLVGTAWENGDDSHSGDYYEVGRLCVASVKYAWHILDEVYAAPANHFHMSWMKEWNIDVESSLKLAEVEEILDNV